jgi:Na+/H+-dicarboxylate symporter
VRLGKLVVMTAVVATMLYWPIGIGLAVICALIGFPFNSLVTFGGYLGTVAGTVAWWLVVFAATLPYAAVMFPWDSKADGFRSADARDREY